MFGSEVRAQGSVDAVYNGNQVSAEGNNYSFVSMEQEHGKLKRANLSQLH